MSKLVVDLLHAVEVDEEEQEALMLAASEIEIRRSLFEQAATIEQAGEIVFERSVAECLFDLLAFGDVAHNLHESAAVDTGNRDLQWQRAAVEFESGGFTSPRPVAPDCRHDLFFEPRQFIFEEKSLPGGANQAVAAGVTEDLRVSVVHVNANTAMVDDGHAVH